MNLLLAINHMDHINDKNDNPYNFYGISVGNEKILTIRGMIQIGVKDMKIQTAAPLMQ